MRTSARRTARSRTAERTPPALRLAVQNAAGVAGLPARTTLRRWLARALARDATVTVRFVSPAEGRRLNRTFRGRDYATNVLTFVYDVPAPASARAHRTAPPLTGDIVLCVAVLRREARAQRKSLRAHCAHLVIHGALHLSGYDHESAKDARVMEALEVELLDSLGYDNPYATEAAPG